MYIVNNNFLNGKLYCAKPQAAGTPTKSCPNKTNKTIFTEFQYITKNSGVSNKSFT